MSDQKKIALFFNYHQMKINRKTSLFFFSFSLIYVIALYNFYVRYVPLVKSFQIIFIPILFAVTILTTVNIQSGALFFIFSFPLINNLPYFFRIYEPVPHAPTALVLLLFFFLGWVLHYTWHKFEFSSHHSIFNPLVGFSIIIFISGLITFFRYANFYPFIGDYIYELITNTNGVTAGGAIMSTLFNLLSYLTGFAFFFIYLQIAKSDDFRKKTVLALLFGTALSLFFGLYQHLVNGRLGNNPLSINQGLINATLKDAMSFGIYIAITFPVILGLGFTIKGLLRVFSFLIALLSLYLIFFTGSKSGLLCLFISIAVYASFSLKAWFSALKRKTFSFRSIHWSSWTVILFFVGIGLALAIGEKRIFKEISSSRTLFRFSRSIEHGDVQQILQGRINTLWKTAVLMIKEYPFTGVGIGGYIIEDSNVSWLAQKPNWKHREKTVTFEKAIKQIRPYCLLYSTVGTAWFDDLYVEAGDGVNRIINPGMEEGDASPRGWGTVDNDVTVESGWTKGIAHSGQRSIMIKNSTGSLAQWVGEAISFTRPYPQTLTLGGWARGDSIAGGGLFTLDFFVEFEDGSKSWYYEGLTFNPGIRESVSQSAENYILQIGSELGLAAVFLILWIFWEIIKQMKTVSARLAGQDQNKYISIGLLSGILSFFANIQFHTYIGSYEIQYTFWLLVGLLFSLSNQVRTKASEVKEPLTSARYIPLPTQKPFLIKKFKILIIMFAFLYGAIHLWNSTHSLSLKSRTEQFDLKQEFGLDKLEKTADGREFRWTRNYGGLPLKIEKPFLVVPLHASHPDIQKKPVQVRIYLVKDFFKHKTFLKEITLSRNDWQDIVLSAPEDVGQEAILLIKVSRTWNPLKTTGVPDPRNLGVAVGKVTFRDK